MKNIQVKSQKEFDALPKEFTESTQINVTMPATEWLTIKATPKNSIIILRDSSHAELRDSSHARLCDSSNAILYNSSHAELRDSSYAVLCGSSYAELRDSSHAVLRDSSYARLCDSSHARLCDSSNAVLCDSSNAVLWDSSHAELRDSSNAVLCDSSHAELWDSSYAELLDSSNAVLCDSSHAELLDSSNAVLCDSSHARLCDSSNAVLCDSSNAVLWDSSHAELRENSMARVGSQYAKIDKIKDQAIVAVDVPKCGLPAKRSKNSKILKRKGLPERLFDLKSFIDYFSVERQGDYVILYKSVDPANGCDFYTGKIKYEGVVECPDFDSDPTRECGGGLHLSPTRGLALHYNVGRLLKCKVHVKDMVIYPSNGTKVRCRKVEVLGDA